MYTKESFLKNVGQWRTLGTLWLIKLKILIFRESIKKS